MKRDAMLEQLLMDFLESNKRRKFACHQVGDGCGESAASCKPILEALAEKGLIGRERNANGAGHKYFAGQFNVAPSPQRLSFSKKEYKPGKEWEGVNERLSEFREIPSKHL